MKFNNKLVSIIIPCYNDAQYIEQSVNSALNQTYPNKEVIVVDDGSNAETKAILNKLALKITKLITQENAGVCVARNKAIENANGEFILTLDSDDFFEPNFLTKAVKVLENNKDVGMVTSWVQVINEKGTKLFMQKPTGADAVATLYHNNSMGSCLFRKKAWVEIGGYDINMKNGFEDWEFNISVTKKGWKVVVIPEVLFNYRYKISSRNSNAQVYQKEIRAYVFNKHKDIAIENYEKTLNFFLDEIEKHKKINGTLKDSYSYKIGHTVVLFLKSIVSVFSFLKRKE